MLSDPQTPLVKKFREEVIDKFHPGVKFIWKEESVLMKIVYWMFLMPIWNKEFLTNYATAGAGCIWLPKQSWSERSEEERLRTIVHEGAHLYDTKRNPFRPVLVVFPQLFFALLTVGLAFVSPWFLFGFIVAILPIPAPWRYWGEIRAYRLDCRFVEHVWGWDKGVGLHKYYQDRTVTQMSGSQYYFAWPFPGAIRKDLEIDDTKDPYVVMVFDWLRKEGLLQKPFPPVK